jgi:Tfp pilus assembly protein PilF
LLVLAAVACAQTDPGSKDPAYQSLSTAFEALRAKDYDAAIAGFQKAAALSPARADIRKNLAYTLLKTGETEAAREQFGEAMRLEPADHHVALEYAFLCYEARDNAPARKAEARRIFARIRDTGDPETLSTAAQAFRNVDEPLESGIQRWQKALATSTPTFSAHYELAQLAEQRDLNDLAAANYRAAFRLLPERKSVLLELARVEKTRGNQEGFMAALLAASRGGEPRAAELAREQLPERYPYVYEFRNALELDPANGTLHRELAFLLLSMSEREPEKRQEAEQEFRTIVARTPDDYLAVAQLGLLYLADNQTDAAMPLLREVLAHGDAVTANRVRTALKMPLVLEERSAADAAPLDPRTLGERSYQAGFLKDAKRYFLAAHEQNPVDPSVVLKLAWTSNMLHDDTAALHWFDLARRSSDTTVASEADRAYGNLRPTVEFLRTTVWLYPLYSSRRADLFGYGQVKTEFRQKKLPLHPYTSIRLVGDARRTTGGVSPQNLSESAFIFAGGVTTDMWRGAIGWFEAGAMVSYLNLSHSPDYRGGLSFARTRGASLSAEASGRFLETTDDGVFVSHFQNDLLFYSQNRAGYTQVVGAWRLQPYWGGNLTLDRSGQYWANFAETGPGVRLRSGSMPPSMWFNLSAMRGIYVINTGNPGRPNFNDFRVGVWYAFTR